MDSLEKYRLRSFCNSVINENYHRLSMWGLTVINPASMRVCLVDHIRVGLAE